MARNYSSYDFSACLATVSRQVTAPGERNPCVPPPSSLNPYNVTELPGFKIDMLREILENPFFGRNIGACYYAAMLMPPTFIAIDSAMSDPRKLDMPMLRLHEFTRMAFPAPINESSPGQVVGWWWDSVVNQKDATENFISAIRDNCTYAICHTRGGIGDSDITGIGMLISTGMLIILAVIFAIPVLFRRTGANWPPTTEKHRTPSLADGATRSKRLVVRDALTGTLDDLFSAIIFFTLSVQVSSLVYRFWNNSIYDIYMAEVLSLIAATAGVMISAAYWRHNRIRLPLLVGSGVCALLTVILFSAEFYYQHDVMEAEGLLMERACLKHTIGGTNLNKLGGKRVHLPVCFALWCLTLLTSLFHLRWVRDRLPVRRSEARSGMRYFASRLAAASPLLFGIATLTWLCVLFYKTWMDMEKAFGAVFVNTASDWGFGQFLALATWFPPILQCADLYLTGMTSALTKRLPWPWVAWLPGSASREEGPEASSAVSPA